jgi:hypothetical protein
MYINEAHRRFARRALCLRDAQTPSVTQVKLVPQQSIYKLHPSVLRVTSARHQDCQTDLMRISHTSNFTFSNPHTDFVDYTTVRAPGRPMRFTTDESLELDDEHEIRIMFDTVPNDEQLDKIVYLRVIRLPIDDLTTKSMSAEPEIPVDWQIDMLEWAAWRALRNWDVDAEAEEKAERHRKRFDEAIAECLKEVQQKKLFQPVNWKFGGNGYTYTR